MNPYLNTVECAKRLYKEYLRHPRLCIALDFDNSIFDVHNQGHTYEDTISLIKKCQKLNFYITIFTASDESRHLFILEHCKNIGIDVAAINKNPIPLPYGNYGKIYYNILLDDRAGLGEASDTLKMLLWMIEFSENNP